MQLPDSLLNALVFFLKLSSTSRQAIFLTRSVTLLPYGNISPFFVDFSKILALPARCLPIYVPIACAKASINALLWRLLAYQGSTYVHKYL